MYEEGAKHFSGRRTLLVIRVLPILLVSLSSISLYYVAQRLTGDSNVALAAVLIFALHPVSIGITSLTILEPGLIFFYTTSLWLFLSSAVEPYAPILVIASGLAMGFALASREGGYFLPLTVVVVSIVGTIIPSAFSLMNTEYAFLLGIWLTIGAVVLYVTWPYIWRHPLMRVRENLANVSRMKGEKEAGWSYNARELVAGTPSFLTFLGILGIAMALLLGPISFDYVVILFLPALPLLLLSMPTVPQRGIHAVFFVAPFLSIFPAIFLVGFSHQMGQLLGITSNGIFYVMLAVVAVALLFVDLRAHPYYMQYRDRLTGRLYKWDDNIGQWGEGMDRAMACVDANAPANSEIWIYGLKFPALYHSSRVNVSESLKGEPLFYTRYQETGYGAFDDEQYRLWKQGDLRFYFPFYYPNISTEALKRMLEERNVSFVVLHRWAMNNPKVTANSVDSNNYEFLIELSQSHVPAYVVRIRGNDLCWIYDVRTLRLGQKAGT